MTGLNLFHDGMSLYRGYLAINKVDPSGLIIETDTCKWLDAVLRQRHIKFTRTGTGPYIYSAGTSTREKEKQGFGQDSLTKLILWRMLLSPTTFSIAGKSRRTERTSMFNHINTRIRVVRNTESKKYTFGAGNAFLENHTVNPEPNLANDPQAYLESINNQGTSIACLAATQFVFYGAIGKWLSGDASRPHNDIWIPGDWGYINNAAQDKNRKNWATGYEGENIIMVGNLSKGDVFWGHITSKQTVRTIDEWFDAMKKWPSKNKKEIANPILDSDVSYPKTGLE